ncbi:hypothetical protein ACKFKF_02905 [Phormidesmis sp. 146-12]
MSEEKIWIITDSEPLVDRPDGARGWGEELQQRVQVFREKQLDVAELERKMETFLQMVGRIFSQAEQQAQAQSKIKLDEIELSVEISAEGEIKLVAGGKGSIKLKFKRVS